MTITSERNTTSLTAYAVQCCNDCTCIQLTKFLIYITWHM